jgi:CheY-like chemotaxis protein
MLVVSKKRLLIIDDDKDFGEYVRQAAERAGFEAHLTTRARDFKRVFEIFKPDVIMLEVVMPEVDGIELISWLGDQGCTANLIIVTSYSPKFAEMAKKLSEAKGMTSAITIFKGTLIAEIREALAFQVTHEGKAEMKNGDWHHKEPAQVRLVKLDGSILEGKVFCAKDERVSDVITDEKSFLPFESDDGEFHVITKATLSRVIPIDNGAPIKVSTSLDQLEVEIMTIGGETRKGKVFVRENQRVVDVLNSDPTFLAIETEREELEIINKNTIDQVTPIEMRLAA